MEKSHAHSQRPLQCMPVSYSKGQRGLPGGNKASTASLGRPDPGMRNQGQVTPSPAKQILSQKEQ